MSASTLPEHPNLEQLKKQAKDLLKAYRAGDDAARERFKAHPRDVTSDGAKLTDAQLALARGYGFDSWPKLRRDVAGRQLRSAIWSRNLASVKDAIDAEPETVHASGPHPRFGGQPTPIQIASERGDIDIVRTLLDEGADPDSGTDVYGWSALQLAAHWGHTQIVDLLIGRGAKVDIFTCALLGDAEGVARILTDDPEAAKTSGLSDAPPLHVASTPEVARILLEHGAPLESVDTNGNTPLVSAIGNRNKDTAVYLIEQGARVHPCMLAALGLTDRLAALIDERPDAIHDEVPIGQIAVVGTSLHAAAQHNQTDVVELLLAKGADPNARADMGQTPLHLCSDSAIARQLVEAGADPTSVDDEHGTTPLTWAKIGIDIHGESPERRELVTYLETVGG